MKLIKRSKDVGPYNIENVYIGRPRTVMKILGVWLPAQNESMLQKFYRYFMVSLQFLFLIFQVVYVYLIWGDFEEVSQASYLLFTQACLCFKLTVFLVNTGRLSMLLEVMDSDIMKPESKEHERFLVQIMLAPKSHASKIKRILYVFLAGAQSTCGLLALKPLFDEAGSREFPYKMWMPVGTKRSPQYELGYCFQLLTLCISATMFYGVDSVTLSMVIFGCAQIDIIKDKILSIKNISMQDRTNSGTVKKLLRENYKKLVDCIKRHQTVAKFIAQVENAYHSYLLFTLSGGVGMICMSALCILEVDLRSVLFLCLLFYMSVMVSQIYVCCWCGHEVTARSEELFVVLYECPWYEQDVLFKRTLCFAMLCMSRPLVFRAGHYVPLLRQTFVAVLRMSYSYFAILRQAHRE